MKRVFLIILIISSIFSLTNANNLSIKNTQIHSHTFEQSGLEVTYEHSHVETSLPLYIENIKIKNKKRTNKTKFFIPFSFIPNDIKESIFKPPIF